MVITTIVLKILLIIILVIVILLHFSVTLYVSGGTDGEFVIKAKYLGITLYPRKKKAKKKKTRRKKEEVVEDEFDDDLTEELENSAMMQSVSEEKPEVTLEDEVIEDTAEEAVSEETIPEETPPEDEPEEDKKPEKKEKKKKEKKEKKKKEKKPKEDSDEGGKAKGKLEELKAKWDFIRPYIPHVWKYSKKLLKAIRIEQIKIAIDTGKEDAYESATFYGKLQAAVFNVLHLLSLIFTVDVKEVNINCLFNVKKLDAKGETTIRLRPSTVIAIAFCLLWCCAKIFIPYKLKQRRERKAAEKAKKKKNTAASPEPA